MKLFLKYSWKIPTDKKHHLYFYRNLQQKEKSLAELQEQLTVLQSSEEILKKRVQELELSEKSLQERVRDVQNLELSSQSLQQKFQDLQISYNTTQEKLSQSKSVEITNKTLQQEIKSLQTCNNTLQRRLDDALQNSTANNLGVGNKEVLLERILELERSEKILKEKLEVPEGTVMGTMDKPEDVLRQRIGELERLEKHLKQQVSSTMCCCQGYW